MERSKKNLRSLIYLWTNLLRWKQKQKEYNFLIKFRRMNFRKTWSSRSFIFSIQTSQMSLLIFSSTFLDWIAVNDDVSSFFGWSFIQSFSTSISPLVSERKMDPTFSTQETINVHFSNCWLCQPFNWFSCVRVNSCTSFNVLLYLFRTPNSSLSFLLWVLKDNLEFLFF